MKTVLLGIVALLIGVVTICVLSYISAYNAGNRLEANIRATYSDNQNILAQYSNAVAEAASLVRSGVWEAKVPSGPKPETSSHA